MLRMHPIYSTFLSHSPARDKRDRFSLVFLAYILRMFVSYNITKRMHLFSNVQTGANCNDIKDKEVNVKLDNC